LHREVTPVSLRNRTRTRSKFFNAKSKVPDDVGIFVRHEKLNNAAKREPGFRGVHQTMPSRCLSGIKILLVEDHASLRSVLRQFLQEKGAKVTTCRSASDGTDKVRRERPELVLTDLNLPDADGFQLMKNIRKFDAESGRNTRVLAMSALGDFVADELAIAAGFYSYLPKPFSPKQLLMAIRLALEFKTQGG
jgi:CheY-like chemotaxis protein